MSELYERVKAAVLLQDGTVEQFKRTQRVQRDRAGREVTTTDRAAVLWKRNRPLFEDRPYVVNAVDSDAASLFSGTYDLTLDEAVEEFEAR